MLARTTTRFLSDESGATAIEYGLLAGMIAVVLITTVLLLGETLTDLFDYGVGAAARIMGSVES